MLKKVRPGITFDRKCLPRLADGFDEPERIVGLGFRHWMLGRSTGDVASLERAWQLYSGVFGTACGRLALDNLSSWVGALSQHSCRRIEIDCERAQHFCRDECVAISMIAACQHQFCPAAQACAFALVNSSAFQSVVSHAENFATTLAGLDYVLSPQSIVTVVDSLSIAQSRPN